MIQIITRDQDEAVSAVSRVYCPHDLQLDRRTRSATTRLRAGAGEGMAYVALEYGAKADVDAGALEGLTLVMHAVRGTGTVRQRGRKVEWRGGQTVVVSGNQPTLYTFGASFAQSTVRLDPADIRLHCEQLLGITLEGDVRFELTPFSAELEALWSQVLAMSVQGVGMPASSHRHLEKLAIDLLLHRCPHNYSHLFAAEGAKVPRLAAQAIDFIDSLPDYDLLTVAEVAARLGVSARTLERAFQESFGMGPAHHLRLKRLDRVRRQLEAAAPGTSVADVAAAYGFYNPGRFAKYYKERYGELPSATIAGVSHLGER
ncbi:AraC family transcriptional regulator [Nonomuraea sp. NPDC049480]|uniref:AraC family transcriptional regulator n=1 Tax=Nonomuraea sp. NPDC049480 TaxID=3364353 RepID=UPI003788DC1C